MTTTHRLIPFSAGLLATLACGTGERIGADGRRAGGPPALGAAHSGDHAGPPGGAGHAVAGRRDGLRAGGDRHHHIPQGQSW
jgi:hypothetical protein